MCQESTVCIGKCSDNSWLSSWLVTVLVLFSFSCAPEDENKTAKRSEDFQLDAQEMRVFESIPLHPQSLVVFQSLVEDYGLKRDASLEDYVFLMRTHSGDNLGLLAAQRYFESLPSVRRVAALRSAEETYMGTPLGLLAFDFRLRELSKVSEEQFLSTCAEALKLGSPNGPRRVALLRRAEYYRDSQRPRDALPDYLRFFLEYPDQTKALDLNLSIHASMKNAGYRLEAFLFLRAKDYRGWVRRFLEELNVLQDSAASEGPVQNLSKVYLDLAPDVSAMVSEAGDIPASGVEMMIFCDRAAAIAALTGTYDELDGLCDRYTKAFEEVRGTEISWDAVLDSRCGLAVSVSTAIQRLRDDDPGLTGAEALLQSAYLIIDANERVLLEACSSDSCGTRSDRLLMAYRTFFEILVATNTTNRRWTLISEVTRTTPFSETKLAFLRDGLQSALERSETIPEADSFLRQLEALNPMAAELCAARLQLADWYEEQGQLDLGYLTLAGCEGACAHTEYAGAIQLRLGRTLCTLGDIAQGLKIVAQIPADMPEDRAAPLALLWMADYFSANGQEEKTRSILSELSKAYPETAEGQRAKERLGTL